MSDYRVTVTVPVALADTAAAVGRAMDIDVGGADSFVPVYASYDSYGKPVGEPIELCAQTWASQEFTEMFQYLIANPIGLYMAVSADYALRWSAMVPPDLSSIEAFCNAATLRLT